MTIEEAVVQAQHDLPVTASEEAIATLAATRYCESASPAELDSLCEEEACREVFEALLERAQDWTEAQIQAMGLTEEQAARMVARRLGH
jgi:hypothetical protein